MRHVVWDWNGTLFSDREAVLAGLNAVLEQAGRPPITVEVYQRLYTRPVQVFYERLFERPIADDEWGRIDDTFHVHYAGALGEVGLASDAHEALERVTAAGRTQSLLSMLRHHELEPLIDRFDLGQHFVRVDGLVGPGGGRKAAYLEAHLERLVERCGDEPEEILVVGDALDDAHAAADIGARCVLYDGGSHMRTELERMGVPVVDTLLDAITIAGID